jgi:hypothetical protein
VADFAGGSRSAASNTASKSVSVGDCTSYHKKGNCHTCL